MNKKLLVENLENKQNIILFFNSSHCGACQTAKPIVEKIVKSKKDYLYSNITEGSLDSEQLEKFCGVEFYPTLVIIENGKVKRYVGLKQLNEIK